MSEVMNIPQLRFPEFGGEWKENKLGDIATFSKGKGISKSDIDNDGQLECIRYGELYTTYNELIKDIHSKTNVSKENVKLSQIGDVIIPASGETAIDIATASCVLKDGVAIGGDLNIIRSNIDGVFNAYYLNNKNKNSVARLSQGSSVIHLYPKHLEILKLNLPAKPEQQKIAAFLTAVDTKIEQLSKKKALLGEYKKGLMQKIFSQAIRFKADDGSDFHDWEERVLGDYLAHKSKKNKNNEVDLVLSVSNKKGFITQDEQFDGYQVASKDLTNYKIVEKGEYAYNPSRINVGSIARLKNNTIGIVSPMYVVFKLKNLDSIFFDNLYQTHLFKHLIKVGCSGSVRDSLNFNDMADFVFSFPSLEEQTKIANFLSSIDSKIEQVGKQLDESKQFKKALLQQMFV